VRFAEEYPVTVNGEAGYDHVAATVDDLFGAARFQRMRDPDPGSEDFSRVLQRVPGAYLFLGAATADNHVGLPNNHSPRATFDDAVLVDGSVLLAGLALRHSAG
jgi:hippurate hydrolase